MNSIYLIFAGLILWPNLASASKTFHCVCNSEGPNMQASIIDLTMSDVYSLPDQGLTTTTQSPVPIPVIVVPQPDNQANQDVINELNKQDSEFDKCQQLFQRETLAAHNNYRFIHHVNPLKSNLMLQKTALNYANYLASNDIFQHSGTQGMGENLAYVWSSRVNTLKDCSGFGARFSKMWYDEVNLYDFNNPGFSASTGHFTQLVWKATTDVGCGIAISVTKRIYGVCNYTPPGNFVGTKEFTNNVLPK